MWTISSYLIYHIFRKIFVKQQFIVLQKNVRELNFHSKQDFTKCEVSWLYFVPEMPATETFVKLCTVVMNTCFSVYTKHISLASN